MEHILNLCAAAMLLLDAPLLSEKLAEDPDAKKMLRRATILHNVLKAKLPDIRLDDLKTMTGQWIHGMLDATFPLETALVDADCADAARRRLSSPP